MKQFSLALAPKYERPLIDLYGMPALIDTGAVIPVFSIYPQLLEIAFESKLIALDKQISGFGGEDNGSIYEIKNFMIGKLIFKNLEVFVPDEPKIKYPILLSATMFYGMAYEIDTINNTFNVRLRDETLLERNFKIISLRGRLYPQIC